MPRGISCRHNRNCRALVAPLAGLPSSALDLSVNRINIGQTLVPYRHLLPTYQWQTFLWHTRLNRKNIVDNI